LLIAFLTFDPESYEQRFGEDDIYVGDHRLISMTVSEPAPFLRIEYQEPE
jgi:hypothetical protein